MTATLHPAGPLAKHKRDSRLDDVAAKTRTNRTRAPSQVKTAPMRSQLYPQYRLPIVRELDDQADEFDLRREQFLLGYGLNTARAYWADLEDWRDWCQRQQPKVEPLSATERDRQRYLDEMGEAGYSRNTIRRRFTAVTKLSAARR